MTHILYQKNFFFQKTNMAKIVKEAEAAAEEPVPAAVHKDPSALEAPGFMSGSSGPCLASNQACLQVWPFYGGLTTAKMWLFFRLKIFPQIPPTMVAKFVEAGPMVPFCIQTLNFGCQVDENIDEV